MSDEQKEQVGRNDDDADDVEGHQLGSHHDGEMDQVGAQEEPPDVEGHQFGAAAAQNESREP